MRVAAVQYEVGTDPQANLAAGLRMIDAAAERGAELIVLPEFCNHLSWYESREHARALACRHGDAFLTAIAARASRHRAHVKLGVTLARPDGRTTGASLLYGPGGGLLGEADKQVLMGAENDHLDAGDSAGPVVPTAVGRLGMYACMEGVICEVTRGLALRGAQVLLNSLNSFAVDEAALHVPVRAAENQVWVVAANKVGPLIPADRLAQVSAGLGVPAEWLHGAGESQIVAPDGTVVERAPRAGRRWSWRTSTRPPPTPGAPATSPPAARPATALSPHPADLARLRRARPCFRSRWYGGRRARTAGRRRRGAADRAAGGLAGHGGGGGTRGGRDGRARRHRHGHPGRPVGPDPAPAHRQQHRT
ncbi:carbon-nitrogen hydrolase family protein [Nonomuraea thailandensis]